MDYIQRKSLIIKSNDGNHINGEPPERFDELESETCPCDSCGKEMDMHQHYVNGGLCYSCIMAIGK